MIAIMKLKSGMDCPTDRKGDATCLTDVDTMRYSRYRTMEAAANRLQKEAKGYLDSLRGVF